MKRSAAVEVKQVIAALCRLLAAAGLDSVPPPEAFRRSKFGNTVQEDPFWQLLADILQTAGIVSPDSAEPGAAGCRKLVAAGLWQSGFHADWMYEDEEGGNFSSRDLLLALGWLLAAGALENVVMKRVQKLDRMLLTCTPVKPHLSTGLQIDSASLRRLQWLIGCLRHQRRMLLSMLQERTRALHAVLSASIASPAPASSAQSSAALREECVCVQQLCDLLEAYLKWKQVEDVFWTWMDSVVDFHLKDPATRRPKHPPNESLGVCRHGNCRLEKLEEMLLRLSTAQSYRLEKFSVWRLDRIHSLSPTWDRVLQRDQRRGAGEDREGEERLLGGCGASSSLPPLLSSLPSLPSLPQVCRARLRPEESQRRPVGRPCGRAEAPNQLPASEAVELLRHAEAVLMKRRDRQRLANRMKLQETISRLDELVLIPP